MSFVVASLTGVTGTGPGTATDLLGFTENVTLQVSTTGGPSSVIVSLEGSFDGTNWFATGVQVSSGGSAAATFPDYSTTPSPSMRFVRARLVQLSGGGTVSANICVRDVH